MTIKEAKKELALLKSRVQPPAVSRCLVDLPDGTQKETTIEEWFDHRKEWTFKRMTRNSDPAAVMLVLANADEEVAEWCTRQGDAEGAKRMLEEADNYVSEYRRRKW